MVVYNVLHQITCQINKEMLSFVVYPCKNFALFLLIPFNLTLPVCTVKLPCTMVCSISCPAFLG